MATPSDVYLNPGPQKSIIERSRERRIERGGKCICSRSADWKMVMFVLIVAFFLHLFTSYRLKQKINLKLRFCKKKKRSEFEKSLRFFYLSTYLQNVGQSL